jgi:hypothetical protein
MFTQLKCKIYGATLRGAADLTFGRPYENFSFKKSAYKWSAHLMTALDEAVKSLR